MVNDEGVLLVAHGTVENPDDLVPFLTAIARGRPPSAELEREMRARYEAIGGSPLLAITRRLADGVRGATSLPTYVGMRFGDAPIADALREAWAAGARRLALVPLAPFSVHVYVDAARAAAAALGEVAPELRAVEPWGLHPGLVAAFCDDIATALRDDAEATVLLTAHSLPVRLIDAGDPYVEQLDACARAVEARLRVRTRLVFQSAGASPGEWLGPSLAAALADAAGRGERSVVVAPIGFLAEHVETLYDLDVEARAQAEDLGLRLRRVATLGADPRLVAVVADLARRALASPMRGPIG